MSDPFDDLCKHGWLWDGPCVWCENERLQEREKALLAAIEIYKGGLDPVEVVRENKRLTTELDAATKWNHSVAVCREHVHDIVEHDGCVICRIEELDKGNKRLCGAIADKIVGRAKEVSDG